MIGRRAIFSLCILCALAFSASATQGAAAAGGRLFTCVNTAPVKDFATEHCKPGQAGTAYGHVAITEPTHLGFDNDKTNATTTGPTNSVFKETIAGTNLELESTGAIEGLGAGGNEEVGGEWRGSVETNANGLTYNGVIVKAPAGKGCKVFEDKEGVKGTEGVVETKPVKGHTLVTETTTEVVIEPVTSSVFATFFIECEKGKGVPPELEGTWEITGSLKCPTQGAEISCGHSEITTQKTLKGKGAKAGLEGSITVSGGKVPITEPTHPMGVTKVP
jgi:hypothetical protein